MAADVIDVMVVALGYPPGIPSTFRRRHHEDSPGLRMSDQSDPAISVATNVLRERPQMTGGGNADRRFAQRVRSRFVQSNGSADPIGPSCRRCSFLGHLSDLAPFRGGKGGQPLSSACVAIPGRLALAFCLVGWDGILHALLVIVGVSSPAPVSWHYLVRGQNQPQPCCLPALANLMWVKIGAISDEVIKGTESKIGKKSKTPDLE